MTAGREGGSAESRDAETLETIVAALYETITGLAGQPRDWERERALFAPGAILAPTRALPDGGVTADVFDLDGYIASRSRYFAENDLFEREVGRQTFRSGSIAHVLSSYEARRRPEDPEPLWSGVNSIQLYHDGRRWWILSLVWEGQVRL
ncbi:MAG: hypothetical protein ACRD3M_17945 [Thermoanaerobaculia bacterium]